MKLVMALDKVLVEGFTEQESLGLNLTDKEEPVHEGQGGKHRGQKAPEFQSGDSQPWPHTEISWGRFRIY